MAVLATLFGHAGKGLFITDQLAPQGVLVGIAWRNGFSFKHRKRQHLDVLVDVFVRQFLDNALLGRMDDFS
jgi:hypothetical protein